MVFGSQALYKQITCSYGCTCLLRNMSATPNTQQHSHNSHTQSTSSTVGPPAPPGAALPNPPPGMPPSGIPPPPAAWYTFIMIGLTTPSSSFCFDSNSSFSASWFLSSQSKVSCTAFSILSLSSPSNLSLSFSSESAH